MTRLLWFAGWTGVAIWSLFAFAVYGFLDVIGGAGMRHADLFSTDPDTVVWISNAFGLLRGLSTILTLLVWGLVSLAILSVPWLVSRFSARVEPFPGGTPPARRDGVIDLAPGDYTIRRPEDTRAGSVPRIGPSRG